MRTLLVLTIAALLAACSDPIAPYTPGLGYPQGDVGPFRPDEPLHKPARPSPRTPVDTLPQRAV